MRVGTDCSGIEAPIQALRRLGVPFSHRFSSDIDPHVQRVLREIYKPEVVYEDLMDRDHAAAPEVDLYIAGFPCQPFSYAGRSEGFSDIRGTVFFGCADYIRHRRPEVFVLENVKGLMSDDKGRTFQTIIDLLSNGGGTVNGQISLDYFTDGLGYHVYHSVINSKDHGIPQNRERIFIVGFREFTPFTFPAEEPLDKFLADVLLDEVPEKFILSDAQIEYMGKEVSTGKNHWDYGHHSEISKGYAQAITANLHKGVPYGVVDLGDNYRRLTPMECFLLQDFSTEFFTAVESLGISDTQLYRMAGNSMTVRVVEKLLRKILI